MSSSQLSGVRQALGQSSCVNTVISNIPVLRAKVLTSQFAAHSTPEQCTGTGTANWIWLWAFLNDDCAKIDEKIPSLNLRMEKLFPPC